MLSPGVDDELRGLLARVVTGDAAAIARFYDLTVREVWSVAHRMTQDREAAQQVVETVYCTVWREAGLYTAHGRRPPQVWLLGLTHRACRPAGRDTSGQRRRRVSRPTL